MSKIEESLIKASQLRKFASDDKSNKPGVYKKDERRKKWLYIPIVIVCAFVSVIISLMLFINTNKVSQRPTHALTKKGGANSQTIEEYIKAINTNKVSQRPAHAVTKKGETNSQTIEEYVKAITNNKNAYHSLYTIQTGSFMKIERAQKQLDFIAQRLDEKKLDYLRIEKIGKFYSIRLGKFEDPFDAEKFLQSIKPHLPTAITMKANIKDERIIRLYKDSSSSVSSTHQTFIE